jgi:hypothetical protein
VSLTPGQQAIADFPVVNGGGDRADWDAFVKAHSGDMVFLCTPAAPTVKATSSGWSLPVTVQLATADGEVHKWFQGPITLAIADTSAAGTASITPAAGAHNMVDGELSVTISGDAAAWLAAETATLSISSITVIGYTVPAKTCVVTIN